MSKAIGRKPKAHTRADDEHPLDGIFAEYEGMNRQAPGKVLRDVFLNNLNLQRKREGRPNLDAAQIARETGLAVAEVEAVLRGAPVTKAIAKRLEAILNRGGARLLLRMQEIYDSKGASASGDGGRIGA